MSATHGQNHRSNRFVSTMSIAQPKKVRGELCPVLFLTLVSLLEYQNPPFSYRRCEHVVPVGRHVQRITPGIPTDIGVG